MSSRVTSHHSSCHSHTGEQNPAQGEGERPHASAGHNLYHVLAGRELHDYERLVVRRVLGLFPINRDHV